MLHIFNVQQLMLETSTNVLNNNLASFEKWRRSIKSKTKGE